MKPIQYTTEEYTMGAIMLSCHDIGICPESPVCACFICIYSFHTLITVFDSDEIIYIYILLTCVIEY